MKRLMRTQKHRLTKRILMNQSSQKKSRTRIGKRANKLKRSIEKRQFFLKPTLQQAKEKPVSQMLSMKLIRKLNRTKVQSRRLSKLSSPSLMRLQIQGKLIQLPNPRYQRSSKITKNQKLSKNRTSNKRVKFPRSRTRNQNSNSLKVFGQDINRQQQKEERNKKRSRGSRQRQRHSLKRRKR